MIRTVILIGWFISTLVLKIPSRVSIIIGVMALCGSALTMITNHQGYALRLTTYAFGFFMIGFVSYVLELKRDEKK